MSGGHLSEPERRRNARELARLMAELDELDARHGLGAYPGVDTDPVPVPTGRHAGGGKSRRTRRSGPSAPRRTGPPRGERARAAVVTVVSLLVLAFVVVDTVDVGVAASRFTAWLAGEPAPPRDGRGYAFLETQPGSTDDPVGWDPCTPIRVLLNPEGSPPGGERLVQTALDRTAAASGLQFEMVGETDSRDFFEPDRRLDAPVLVGWAPSTEVEALEGRVAGVGGASSTADPGFRRYFVAGTVVLDGPLFRTLVRDGNARDAQAVIDHEVGHLVGLAHVRDSSQLMNAESGPTEFGAGDLAGLTALGDVPCDLRA